MEGHTINAKINQSKETMEIWFEMDFSIFRMDNGETLEFFVVLQRLKGETSHRTIYNVNPEVINLTILLSADLTIDRRTVSYPMIKKFPENNNQTPSNVVRFSTTDDTINGLSDLCPLNY